MEEINPIGTGKLKLERREERIRALRGSFRQSGFQFINQQIDFSIETTKESGIFSIDNLMEEKQP